MLQLPEQVCVVAEQLGEVGFSFNLWSFLLGVLVGGLFTAIVMVVWEILAR